MRIDSHQHFWSYNPKDYQWIDDSMTEIKKDFLPLDLQKCLQDHSMDGSIAIQCNHCEAETVFLLNMAKQHDFVKGVVGWVDLTADNLKEKLTQSTKNPYYKGVRHLVQNEADGFMLGFRFNRGIGILKKFNLPFDILVYPRQLKEVLKFVKLNPTQPFVIDHLAKPNIKDQDFETWEADIRQIARFPSVFCKVSGMVTEADWPSWKTDDFYPYLNVIFDAFGMDRTMFGSDWPVCNLAAPYEKVIDIVEQFTADFSEEDKAKIFGLNAKKFYNIED